MLGMGFGEVLALLLIVVLIAAAKCLPTAEKNPPEPTSEFDTSSTQSPPTDRPPSQQ